MDVEICIDCSSTAATLASVRAAHDGGAARIELCSEMEVGGLSTDTRSILTARQIFGDTPGVMAMIRPRPGDFYYTPWEIREMGDEIERAAISGADGVVLGVLKRTPGGARIHSDAMSYLIRKARSLSLSITFHRAFDVLSKRIGGLELLIELGLDRILTSGTAWEDHGTWKDGRSELLRLVNVAENRIEIIVAGSVKPEDGTLLQTVFKETSRVSVHAYSGVLDPATGTTAEHLVEELLRTLGPVENHSNPR